MFDSVLVYLYLKVPMSSIPGYDHLCMLEALLPCLLHWIVTSLTFVFPNRYSLQKTQTHLLLASSVHAALILPCFLFIFLITPDIRLHKLGLYSILFMWCMWLCLGGELRAMPVSPLSFCLTFLMSLHQELVEVGWQPASLNNLVVLFVHYTPSAKLQIYIDTPNIRAGVQALYPLSHLSCPEAYSHMDISLFLLSRLLV